MFVEISLVDLDLLSQIKNLKDITVILIADSTEQSSHRQLLLTVDVSIHHIVNVRSKLNPATLERDDTRRIQLSTIRVYTRTKEDTRRTMQLAHHHTLRTIDDKRTIVRHIRDRTEEHILNDRIKILMLGIRTIQFEFSLQRHTIRKTTLQTLLHRVARRVDIIIQKLKNEVVASVSNREILAKHLIQAIILAQFGRSIQLEEVLKRLQLHLKEIRESIRSLDSSEIDSVVNDFRHL